MALAFNIKDEHGPSKEMHHQVQPKNTKVMNAVLAFNVAAKDVCAVYY